MIYKQVLSTMDVAKHNFRIYRLVRLLHNLKVINDQELIRHEEVIWSTLPAGLDVDWYRYRICGPQGEVIQF